MRKITVFSLIMAVSGLLVACSNADADQSARTHETSAGPVEVTQMVDGLAYPWGMEMLPDGHLLVTLRDGEMLVIDPQNPDTRQTVANVPEVYAQGQGGLLDVALDPQFSRNNTIYFTFSDPSPEGAGTAIASARLVRQGEPRLEDVKTLYSMSPKTDSGRHFGSRIVIDPGGNLFFTIGDRGDRPRAQDPMDPAGSVLRIAPDGSIPADNPFADGSKARPEIWSIGHRNAQGAALHPDTGELWTLSHGARGGDEINKPEAGKNYGWPEISYGRHYSGGKIGVGTSAPGLEQPLYYWDPSIAPSGLDFYTGDAIPEWKGNLFAGALKYQLLSRLVLDGDKVVEEEQLFAEEYGRIREVRSFPDGALWFLTDESDGAIYRISRPAG